MPSNDIKKISKIEKSAVDMKLYKTQKRVRRSTKAVGGYEYIIPATDQDLD